MTQIKEYIDTDGRSRYAEWFQSLDARAAAKAATALVRMEQGNFSNVKGVGSGIFEYRMEFGPGYRIYFGKDGTDWVILLGAERNAGNRGTSKPPESYGESTRNGKHGRTRWS